MNDAEESTAQLFFDKTQELLFLSQCVKFNTRIRHNNQASMLDLVFTNEEDMVTEMKEIPPLGKSDHVGIIWRFVVETEISDVNNKKLGLLER